MSELAPMREQDENRPVRLARVPREVVAGNDPPPLPAPLDPDERPRAQAREVAHRGLPDLRIVEAAMGLDKASSCEELTKALTKV